MQHLVCAIFIFQTRSSTTNLMALAKLFGVSAEELLKETQKN